jgi:hypothetical protein
VRHHGGTQVAARELLLLVVALCALRQRLDVGRHGLVHFVHAWGVSVSEQAVSDSSGAHTLMAKIHLQLQGLELVREPGAGLGAHLLVRPLLQAIEFLGDVHGGGV